MSDEVRQRAHAVVTYAAYSSDKRAMAAAYRREHPDDDKPDLCRYMQHWHDTFLTQGCVHGDIHHGRPKKLPEKAAQHVVIAVADGEKYSSLKDAFDNEPAIQAVKQQYGVSDSTLYRSAMSASGGQLQKCHHSHHSHARQEAEEQS